MRIVRSERLRQDVAYARDFDDRARDALVRHGFTEAFSTEEGVNGAQTDWLAVRRFAGDGPVSDLTWRLLRAR